jgi:hypothetical protein
MFGFLELLGTAAVVLAIFVLFDPLGDGSSKDAFGWWTAIAILPCGLAFNLLGIAAWSSQVRIYPTHIDIRAWPYRKILRVDQIALVDASNIQLTRIKTHKGFGVWLEPTFAVAVEMWAESHGIKLIRPSEQAHWDEVKIDFEFGGNASDREAYLDRRRTWAQLYNFGAAGLAIAFLIWSDEAYQILFIGNVFALVFGILVILQNPKIFGFGSTKKAPRIDVSMGIITPSFMIGARAMMDLQMLDPWGFWEISGLIWALTALPLILLSTRGSNHWSKFATVLLIPFAYGAAVITNASFDSSKPKSFTANVLDKSTASGKYHTSYYVMVSPWGPKKGQEELSVPREVYQKAEIGGVIGISLHPGFLGMPWIATKIPSTSP